MRDAAANVRYLGQEETWHAIGAMSRFEKNPSETLAAKFAVMHNEVFSITVW
jgi:hypothetical protein